MIRLFVADDLKAGGEVVPTPGQAHYLTAVMRLGAGDELLVFNGRDGEWRTRLVEVAKRGCRLLALTRERRQTSGPDLDLIVALVKRPRLETIVEKAAELGARRVAPIVTSRARPGRPNIARLSAIAIEAAEQSERLTIPAIHPPQALRALLAAWPADRPLAAAIERAAGAPPDRQAALLVGPEGGFSPTERASIRALGGAMPVSLGPRILRADTAAIAAMTLWQAALGDGRA